MKSSMKEITKREAPAGESNLRQPDQRGRNPKCVSCGPSVMPQRDKYVPSAKRLTGNLCCSLVIRRARMMLDDARSTIEILPSPEPHAERGNTGRSAARRVTRGGRGHALCPIDIYGSGRLIRWRVKGH